jgi:hypothetical protein
LDQCVREGDPQRSASSLTLRASVGRTITDPRSHIVAATQHKPEALARERRNGGIVSLQAAKAACILNDRVRDGDPQRSASSLTLRASVGRLITDPRSHIVAVAQHKPEALARERRYGGIVSLQAAKPHAHWINAFVRGEP